MKLLNSCKVNKETSLLRHDKLKMKDYLLKLPPGVARSVSKVRLGMYHLKVNYKKEYSHNLLCPFCKVKEKTFEHLFCCENGLSFDQML